MNENFDYLKGKVTVNEIINVVSMAINEDKKKITEKYVGDRKRKYAIPRQIICYYAKILTLNSLAEIGENLGGRDHATVIHSVKTVNNYIDTKYNLFNNYFEKTNKAMRNFTLEKKNNSFFKPQVYAIKNEGALLLANNKHNKYYESAKPEISCHVSSEEQIRIFHSISKEEPISYKNEKEIFILSNNSRFL